MNCIIVDNEEMSIKAMKHLVAQVPFLNLVNVCSNAGEALGTLNNTNVNLMLMDIELPDMNGLGFIKGLTVSPLTILVTSKKEYAIEAFECNVIDYLMKPVSIERFFKAITKSKSMFDESNKSEAEVSNGHIFVKANGVFTKINMKDVLWIEALGDYVRINTADKKYTIHSTLKAVETKFNSDRFVRVHRSYIVSVDYIDSIDDNTIVIDKQLIPIGFVYKENFTKHLNLL